MPSESGHGKITYDAAKTQSGLSALSWVFVAFVPIALFGWCIWQQRWMSDDGFINLRVVHNLLAGHGPVFNIGERAEAYTSTLWLGIITFFSALGLRPEKVAIVGGLGLSLVGTVSATWAAARLHAWNQSARLGEPVKRGLSVFEGMLPLGILTYIVLPPAWDYGTSGLETGLSLAWLGTSFLLLTTLAIHTFDPPKRGPHSERAYYGVGAFLGLAPLIRPDLALFSFAFLLPLLMLLFSRERGGFSLAKLVLMGLAMAAIPVGYQIFRMGYFAAIVPNTALAKEAFESRWTQGGHFFNDFFIRYRLLFPLGILGIGWVSALTRVRAPEATSSPAHVRLCLLAVPALCGAAYCAYVVKIGGGFMHGRLFLPGVFGLLLPVASLPIWLANQNANARGILRILLTLLLVGWAIYCGLTLRIPVENQHGIGDERGWYARMAKVENPVLLDDYHDMFFQVGARKLRRNAHRFCPELFGDPLDFFESVARSETLGSGWTPPESCRPFIDVTSTESTEFGALFPSRRDFDVAPKFVDRGIALVAMRTGLGMTSLVLGPQTHIVDHVGLTSPISSRLELARRGRPGHEKALSTPWMVGRFSTPEAGEDPRVSAARNALGCGELRELVDATNAPMSAARFVENLKNARRFHSLRIPSDPYEAAERFCATAPPTSVIAGGKGGKPGKWRCPSGYALSGFSVRTDASAKAVGSLRPDCRPIVNAEDIKTGAPARLEGKSSATPTFGKSKHGRFESIRCPKHFALVGLRGKAGRVVREMTPICAQDLPSKSAPSDADAFEIRCPSDTIAVGASVRAGALIDAVGLLCATPSF